MEFNYQNMAVLFQFPYNVATLFFLSMIFYLGLKKLLFLLKYNELNRRIMSYPNMAEVRAQMGDLFFDRERYDEAYAFYMQALSIHPDLHYARLRIAEVCLKVGRRGDALTYLREICTRSVDDKIIFSVHSVMDKWGIKRSELGPQGK